MLEALQYEGPMGTLVLATAADALVWCDWANNPRHARHRKQLEAQYHASVVFRSNPLLERACQQLAQYFEGSRKQFELPLEFRGGTDFQQRVWKALTEIPFGSTTSYGMLSAQLGQTEAVRAVAAANAANRFMIIVPCHRVVAANGTLHGYAGGLSVKQGLLAHEGARPLEVQQWGYRLFED
jgi:methylated-DNA-[protein]-cysteine S-methyltransferase